MLSRVCPSFIFPTPASCRGHLIKKLFKFSQEIHMQDFGSCSVPASWDDQYFSSSLSHILPPYLNYSSYQFESKKTNIPVFSYSDNLKCFTLFMQIIIILSCFNINFLDLYTRVTITKLYCFVFIFTVEYVGVRRKTYVWYMKTCIYQTMTLSTCTLKGNNFIDPKIN